MRTFRGQNAAGGTGRRASVSGRTVTFTDGSSAAVDVIVCATGFELDIPYLDDRIRVRTGADMRLHLRTVHPSLARLGLARATIRT